MLTQLELGKLLTRTGWTLVVLAVVLSVVSRLSIVLFDIDPMLEAELAGGHYHRANPLYDKLMWALAVAAAAAHLACALLVSGNSHGTRFIGFFLGAVASPLLILPAVFGLSFAVYWWMPGYRFDPETTTIIDPPKLYQAASALPAILVFPTAAYICHAVSKWFCRDGSPQPIRNSPPRAPS